MGDDFGLGSYRLWSLGDLSKHTQLQWAALQQKSKQMEPDPMSSHPLITQLILNFERFWNFENSSQDSSKIL